MLESFSLRWIIVDFSKFFQHSQILSTFREGWRLNQRVEIVTKVDTFEVYTQLLCYLSPVRLSNKKRVQNNHILYTNFIIIRYMFSSPINFITSTRQTTEKARKLKISLFHFISQPSVNFDLEQFSIFRRNVANRQHPRFFSFKAHRDATRHRYARKRKVPSTSTASFINDEATRALKITIRRARNRDAMIFIGWKNIFTEIIANK